MQDKARVKAELAMFGIGVDEQGNCISFRNGQKQQSSIQEEIGSLQKGVQNNKKILRETWTEIMHILSARQPSNFAGGDISQKIFIRAIKQLYKTSKKFRALSVAKSILGNVLNCDINIFSEKIMSTAIEYSLCIEWIHCLIRVDIYKTLLLKSLTDPKVAVANAGGFLGTFNMPDEERMWPYQEDEDDRDDQVNSPVWNFWHDRHSLPETYNKPEEFEPGFYYRADIAHEPYAFGDEDDNPYPSLQHNTATWKA